MLKVVHLSYLDTFNRRVLLFAAVLVLGVSGILPGLLGLQSAGATTSTLNATADTYVLSGSTVQNGAKTTMAQSAATNRALARFDTAAIPLGSKVNSVTLKLFVVSGNASGGIRVHPEIDAWNEATTTWANQPTWNTSVLATSPIPVSGSWLSVPLPVSAITTGGPTSFGFDFNPGGIVVTTATRESANIPQLVIDFTTAGTPSAAPTAVTGVSSAITPTGATIAGTANDNGAGTTCHFGYGTTATYGIVTPDITIAAGTGSTPMSNALTGLLSNTTYNYRLECTNSNGTTLGANATFTTASAPTAPPPPPNGSVDASTLDHKFMLGYQGWHQCPNDGAPGSAWRHWFTGLPSTSSGVSFDAWPDTSELTANEKCDTGLKLPNGQPAYLFSDYNAQTVLRHFQWMQQNNMDGVMLQRFTSELSDPNMVVTRNKVTTNVMAASSQTGRTFDIMYDISGQDPATLVSTIENDWKSQVDTIGATKNSRYLQQGGKPVVVLWGFGFGDRPGTPTDLQTLLDFFHNNPNPAYRAYVMGGVNNDWRTNSTWASALTGFDAISPWMVGRIDSLSSADTYKSTTAAEVAYAKAHNQLFMPVIFPGYSFYNQNNSTVLNQIPRLGGNFVWRQAYNDLSAGSTTLYGAMFDEVNEGTAFFKMATTSADWPTGMQMVPVNADGYSQLPSDWYLKVAGEITKMVRGSIPLSPTMSITPTLTPTPTPSPPPPTATGRTVATLAASADSYITSNSSTANYGTATSLKVSASANRSVVRFDMTAVPAGSTINAVTLKIYTQSSASGGIRVHPSLGTWTETGLTWANQPTWNTSVIATSASPAISTWVATPLPVSAVSAGAAANFGLDFNPSGIVVSFASREDAAHAPQLVIDYTPPAP